MAVNTTYEINLGGDILKSLDEVKKKLEDIRNTDGDGAQLKGLLDASDDLCKKLITAADEIANFSEEDWGTDEAAELLKYVANLKSQLAELNQVGIDLGFGNVVEAQMAGYDEQINGYNNQVKAKSTQTISQIGNFALKVIGKMYDQLEKNNAAAWGAVGKTASGVINGIVKSFKSLTDYVSNKFSKAFDIFGNSGILSGGVVKLLSLVGLTKLSGDVLELSSNLYEYKRIASGVFKDNARDIHEWASSVGADFVDSEEAALKYINAIGTMFTNYGVDTDNIDDMSKSIVALTGDMANFYNISKDDAFGKLQNAIKGSAKALKDYGIELSDAKLDQYLMEKGINATYKSLNDSSKAIVRYNYVLQQMSNVVGQSNVVGGTWANQLDALKGRLSNIGAYIGNVLIKVLYPLVVILNQVAAAALRVIQVMSGIFGFDQKGLDALYGIGENAGIAVDELEDESDAIDEVGKSAKKAGKSLQSFDKLNNQVSSSAGELAGAGSGLDLLPDLYEGIDQDLELPDWLQELKDLLEAGDWEGAGKRFAGFINDLVKSGREFLSLENIGPKIKEFVGGLTDLTKGILQVDFHEVGGLFSDLVNVITFSINELYNVSKDKGIFDDIGRSIEQFVKGLSDNLDWTALGQALATGFRTALEIFGSMISNATDDDLFASLGNNLRDLFLGMLDRAFGGNEGEEGATKLGLSIANIINGAMDFIAALLSKNEDGTDLANEIGNHFYTIITTAIDNLDPSKISGGLNAFARFIIKLLGSLGDTIRDNKDKFVSDITSALNDLTKDGENGASSTLELFADNFATLILQLASLVGRLLANVDWNSVVHELTEGFSTAIEENPIEWKEFKALFKSIVRLGKFGPLIDSVLSSIFKHISEKVGAFVKDNFGALLGILVGSIASGFNPLGALLGGVLGNLVQNLVENFDEIKTKVSTFFSDLFTNIGTWFTNLFTSIGDWFGNIQTTMETKVAEWGTAIGTKLGEILVNIVTWCSDLLESIKTGYENIKTSIEEKVTEWGTAIGTKIGEILVNIVTWGEDVKEAIVGKFTEAKDKGAEILENFKNGISTICDKIKDFFVTLGTNVYDTLTGKFTEAKEKVSEILTNFKTWIKETAEAIGNFFSEGIGQGILNGINTIKSSVTSVVENVTGLFKQLFGINSPSRVMADLAQYLPQGVAKGIEDNYSFVKDAMKGLTDTVDDSFDPDIDYNVIDMKKIDDFYDRMLEKARAFKSDMQDIFADSLLGDFADNFSDFRGISSRTAFDTSSASNSRIEQALSSLVGRMGNITSGGTLAVNLYIDGEQMKTFVIDTIEGKELRDGGF